jgi:hypothetical protein
VPAIFSQAGHGSQASEPEKELVGDVAAISPGLAQLSSEPAQNDEVPDDNPPWTPAAVCIAAPRFISASS